MDTLKSLNDEFGQKHAAYKGILELGDDALTLDKIGEARALKTQLDNLQNRITEFREAGSMKTDLQSYEDFLNKPARDVPHPTGGDGGGGGPADAFKVVGSEFAGNSYFEVRNGVRELVYEDGPGALGGENRERGMKIWNAVRDPGYGDAFRALLRAGGRKSALPLKAVKLLEEGQDDSAGYTVPVDSVINRVIERKPTPTRIKGMVETFNTSREFVEMMKLNYKTDNIYTTGFRVTKTGENPTSATQAQVNDAALFGTIKVPVHTFMIRGLLTQNQIEDSALNLQQWLENKFIQTIEILYDDKILNGTNKMEPAGILNSIAGTGSNSGLDDPSLTYIPSGDANLLTGDGLISIAEDVPEQYDEDCRYVFNKTSTHKAIRLLKDLQDRYLFGFGYQDSGLRQAGRPSDLNGYPYSWSGLMPNVAANAFPVIFGDLKGYMLVNRVGFSVKVLDQVYAESNQVAVVGRVRFGGQVVEPWRLRVQKISVT